MRTLLITPDRPVPMHNGAQRTNHLYRALRSISEVDLVIVSAEPVMNREELQREFGLVADFIMPRPGDMAPFRWLLPWKPNLVYKAAKSVMPRSLDYQPDPAIAQRIQRLIAERGYDLIVGRYLLPTIKSGAVDAGPLCALDIDDLDTQLLLSRLNQPGRPRWERLINRWHLHQTRKILPSHLRKFDLVFVCDDEQHGPGTELHDLPSRIYLPNIPLQAAAHPMDDHAPLNAFPVDKPPVILFVGNLFWQPNALGVDHFVHHIWPTIHAAEPTAIFRIVGRASDDTLLRRWRAVPGVDPVGFVEDLEGCYADCRFTVVPLYSGAGTNIKVLESLYFGRTSVVTEYSHRGYRKALRHNKELLCAGSDDAFARSCIDLLRNPSLCATLGQAGRSAVCRDYSFERFRTIVVGAVQALMARHAAVERGRTAALT